MRGLRATNLERRTRILLKGRLPSSIIFYIRLFSWEVLQELIEISVCVIFPTNLPMAPHLSIILMRLSEV